MEDSVSEEREVCFCTKVQVVCVDSRSVDSSSQDQVGGVQVGGGRVMLFSRVDIPVALRSIRCVIMVNIFASIL